MRQGAEGHKDLASHALASSGGGGAASGRGRGRIMGGSAGREEGKKGQAEGWRREACRVW